LHDKGVLTFDFEQNRWQWDLKEIEGQNITDNVVELMAQKIQLFKPKTQNTLKLASCLGNKFGLKTLAIIQQNDTTKVLESIWEAVETGLIIPLDDHWQTLQTQSSANVPNQDAWFMFLHDRVQQAAYSLLPDKDKGATHLKVGRLLLKSTSEDTLPERIFDIVPHLNQGRHLSGSDKEILQLTSLNLAASEKAMGALAYDSALRILNEVLEVVPLDKFWKKQHSKLFAIYNNKALCEYRLGLFEEAQADYMILQDKAASPQQIGKVYGEAVYLHTTMNQYLEAIGLARKGLAMLKVDFPETITMEVLGEGFAKVKKSLGSRQISDLLDAEHMESDNIIAQFGILNMVIPPAWLAMPEGFAWSALKMVDLSQNYGNNPISSFGYAIYALLLCGQPAQYQEGLEYGELAIELNKKMPNLFVKGTIHFFFNCFVQHWKRHKSHNVALHQVAHQGCSEGGAYVYGVYNIIFYFFQPFCSQTSLDEVATQFQNFMPFVEKVNDQDVLGVLRLLLQVIKNLQGDTATLDSLTNDDFDEDEYLDTLNQRNYGNGLCYFYFSKLLIYYTQGAYDKALAMAQQAQPYYVYMYGLYHQTLYHFYYALTLCKLYSSASPEQQEEFDTQLDEHLATLQNWADTCPENYEYQYLLVTAEIARIRKQPLAIVSELYEKAIASVTKTAKVLVHRALANELYAEYWLEQAKNKVSTVFLKEASYLYHRWGASAKVDLLQHAHQEQMSSLDYLLQMTQQGENGQSLSSHSTTSTHYSHTSKSSTLSLDFLSIIKASQTLAQEVKLDRLLEKMLKIVIQNAGAEKGVLVDCHNDQLKVTLDGNGKQIQLFPKGVLLDKYKDLPASMIRYVKRSSQPLVFEDAREEKRYANDEYIKKTQPKSVVCLPIMRQNKVKVIFYLENNLATNAFTKNRLEILNTLSSQIAISLENALHYQQLEQKVNERTKELHTKNKNITDSIHYGLKIQQAILTNEATLQEKFQSVFIIFNPKDIVSGDFYWFSQLDRHMFLAEIDCTGHGVPGAFMSMIGNKLLNRIVNENKETDPATILDLLHEGIKHDLKQDSRESSDGMDISLCRITYQNPQQIEVVFAGAKQDLFYSHQGNIEILRGVRSSIGGWRGKTDAFKNHKVLLQTGDQLYLSSDGYFDAPNGRRKSFTKKKFIKLLQDINLHPLPEQKERLASALKLHQGEADQRDDITVIGVKL
jgi:serine phosphatase RsbU (regulator of sigma subunit)/tetratricopeptide (TPR) repeat protein